MLAAAAPAAADQAEAELATTANLDGIHLALGPVAAGVRLETGWEGLFGGEIALVRVRERDRLTALGAMVGGAVYSERSGGQVRADLLVGTRLGGIKLGILAGPVVELDDVRPPRWGAHGGLWVFAGVLPYVRAGTLQKTGSYVEIGLKVALPALRW